MTKNARYDATPSFDQVDDVNWHEYSPWLLSVAKRFVYVYRIPCWYGQEEDIAADVAQETMFRMIKRIRQSQQGTALPIHSLQSMAKTIARNYTLDLRRHDSRVVRLSQSAGMGIETSMCDDESPVERAVQQMFDEWTFLQIAREINRLPRKQRCAILIDLANRMDFYGQPTPLQMAFLTEGISLRDYQRPPSRDSVARARHSSLLSLAYKRITCLPIAGDADC